MANNEKRIKNNQSSKQEPVVWTTLEKYLRLTDEESNELSAL
jgi:hypothetical protein